jgi:selenide, water dikinase
LVGLGTSDDAGVYRLTDDLALIQTVDFFTPIVNDPYDFGRIAAANALSDVYAMGGRPLTAMNIVCFPVKDMAVSILKEILRGGWDKVHEAGAILAGGHSVEDSEIKYGLSVTGVVHPSKVLTNANAQVGDALILTKPLGTGILATAIKAGLISIQAEKRVIELMATLNKTAAEVAAFYPVHACTDITGFGLLGHALEMATASKVTFTLQAENIPVLPEVLDHVQMGLVPAGSHANRNFCKNRLHQLRPINPMLLDVLSDAQTSGGLLISVDGGTASTLAEDLINHGIPDAAIIGNVTAESGGMIELV